MKTIILTLHFLILTASCSDIRSKTTNHKIVVIGHFYPLLKPSYLRLLKQQVEAIDNVGAIVFAGDMVAKSALYQYSMLEQEFASYFDVPIYYIPGNHEMSNEALFRIEGKQFANVGNQSFYLDEKKFILFSAHKANVKASNANLDCDNTEALAADITDKSKAYSSSYLILADMRCFKRKKWREDIQPLIDQYIDYVIIGDNESTKYTYTWEEFNGVPYIYQGITHRGHGLSGDNTFVVINGDQIDLHHLNINNALDPAYKTQNKFKKLKQ